MTHMTPAQVQRILAAHDSGREADLFALTGSRTIEGARWLVEILRKQWEGRLKPERATTPKSRAEKKGKASPKRRKRPLAPIPPRPSAWQEAAARVEAEVERRLAEDPFFYRRRPL